MVEATLFCASDETISVERLVLSKDGKQFAEHLSFDLRTFFPFGDESDTEVDLEGLAISEGFLWLVGSHSLKRDEPKSGSDVSKRSAR